MASGRLKLLKDCEMIFLWVATLEFKQADIVRGHIETSIQLYCVLILTYVGVLSPATWFMIGNLQLQRPHGPFPRAKEFEVV